MAQTAVPEIPFDTNADLLKTPQNTSSSAKSAASAPNSKGQIFVYTRTGHPYATLGDNRTFSHGGSRLFQFDSTGKFVRELGQDVYGFNAAIGLRVDPQDNVWTIDVGANQVVKFDADGSVALVLGRKPEAIGVRPARAARSAGGGEARGGGAAAGSRAGARGAERGGRAAPAAPAARRLAGGRSRGGAGGRGRQVRARPARLQPPDRRRVGQGRQHLRRRRHRHQQPRRQVRQGRQVHHALGLDRHRARGSSTA